MKDVQIRIFPFDPEDNKYCAIVMIWGRTSWINSGIVVRDEDPINAFKFAMEAAKKEGVWE